MSTNWISELDRPVLNISPIPTDRPLHADCSEATQQVGQSETYQEPDADKVRAIQLLVCSHYGIDLWEMLGVVRTAQLVEARHIAMWLCRSLARVEDGHIALLFNRDRSLVPHAARSVMHRSILERRLRMRCELLTQSARKLPQLRSLRVVRSAA